MVAHHLVTLARHLFEPGAVENIDAVMGRADEAMATQRADGERGPGGGDPQHHAKKVTPHEQVPDAKPIVGHEQPPRAALLDAV